MISDYYNLICKDNIKLIGALSNNDFNLITGNKSVGHYQYDKKEKYFTFREQYEIHILKKIDMKDFLSCLDKKFEDMGGINNIEIRNTEGKYILFFSNAIGQKYSYQKSNKNIMDLIIDFYYSFKREYSLRKAS